MLVNAVVMDDGDIAGLPVITDPIVDLVARAVEDIERGFVDVAVLLGRPARGIFLEMNVQRLAETVFGLDVMTRGIERSRLSSSVRL
jgi:hypothetical protein